MDEKHDKIGELADAFSQTICKYTGVDDAIVFYGYHDEEGWKYGNGGKGDIAKELGLLELLKYQILNMPRNE